MSTFSPAATGPAATCSTRARSSRSATGRSPRTSRRSSTTRARRRSWTSRRACSSAPTASVRCCKRCRRARRTSRSEELREGQTFWATVDSPWLHKVDDAKLAEELDGIRAMKPEVILSSHLPAVSGDLADRMLASIASVPAMDAVRRSRPGRARADAAGDGGRARVVAGPIGIRDRRLGACGSAREMPEESACRSEHVAGSDSRSHSAPRS